MQARLVRIMAALVAAALVGWWARLIARSKTPPPEGRWHEIDPAED